MSSSAPNGKDVSNHEVETCLREVLSKEGFSLSRPRSHGQNGVDILATKDGEPFHIEVIGYKKQGSARAKDFFEVFFRAVSRLNDGAKHCVVALSSRSEAGLPARAGQYREAWRRIATSFPELEIWLVDTVNRAYRRTQWCQWM